MRHINTVLRTFMYDCIKATMLSDEYVDLEVTSQYHSGLHRHRIQKILNWRRSLRSHFKINFKCHFRYKNSRYSFPVDALSDE